jgi:hypothetical protein
MATPPLREPIADPQTALRTTRPWALFFQQLAAALDALDTLGCCEPLTNGDPVTPELIFADGDVIMVRVSG